MCPYLRIGSFRSNWVKMRSSGIVGPKPMWLVSSLEKRHRDRQTCSRETSCEDSYRPRQVGGSFRASSAAPRKWRKVGNVSFQSLWANFHWRTKKILEPRSPWESKGLIHPLYSISFVDSHAGPGRVFISKVKSAARGRAGMPQPAEERVCVSPSSSYSSL